MLPQIVHVPLSDRDYSIEIGSASAGRLVDFLADSAQASHVLIVVDEAVQGMGQGIMESLKSTACRATLIQVPSGETSKSIDSLASIWADMQAAATDRASVVVAVGGGVVGDLAGFAAATFARGLRFVQVPTTLLAMVDSSVGGKTGINLATAKNMVGAFWQPAAVFADLQALETLPKREFLSGLAEVIKYGVIQDAGFFAMLESNIDSVLQRDEEVLSRVVARCCELKAEVVVADERETTGMRAILNYGHTFAHAFENLLGYGTILHGEAVAIGMDCAARLALMLNRIGSDLVARQRTLIEQCSLPIAVPELDVDEVIATMQRDKKVAHGKLRFVLPTRLGHVELVSNVPQQLVREVLESA